MRLVIRDIDDLKRVRAMNTWLGRPSVDSVEIGHGLTSLHHAQLEAKIRNLFNDCGCAWGSLALAVAAILVMTWAFLAGAPPLASVLPSLAAAAAASFAAKLVALHASHRALSRLLSSLERVALRIQEDRP